MSIVIETKATENIVRTERTKKTKIMTPCNGNYSIIVQRDVMVEVDGVFSHIEQAEVTHYDIPMSDLVASDEVVSFTNPISGETGTIKMKDLPFAIPAAIEILVASKKSTTEATE